jgi:glycosyltransferase involved in cell wall biosynthesis
VLAQWSEGRKTFENVDRVNIHYLKCPKTPIVRSWRFASSTFNKLEELNNELKFDIIHANLPLVPDFAVPTDAKGTLVTTSHSTWPGEAAAIRREKFEKLNTNERFMLRFNRMLRSFEKGLMERARILIAVSQYTKKELLDFYNIPEEKIQVIYNGVDIQKFKPPSDKVEIRRKLGLKEESHIILCVGRLYHRKGLSTLLRSVPSVVSTFDDVKFIFAGKGLGGEEKELSQLAASLKIKEFVTFTGYFPDETLPDLYAASDIFVLPALYENFPFAILEAQASGLPVISTRVGGIPEYVIEGQNGLLTDPGDHDQLTSAIIALLRDTDSATKLGEAGRKQVEEKFSWPLITDQVIKTYRKAMEKPA